MKTFIEFLLNWNNIYSVFETVFRRSFSFRYYISTFLWCLRMFFDILSAFKIVFRHWFDFRDYFFDIFKDVQNAKLTLWAKKTDQKKLDFVRKRFSLHFFDTTWQRMFPCVVGCSEIVKSVKTKKQIPD